MSQSPRWTPHMQSLIQVHCMPPSRQNRLPFRAAQQKYNLQSRDRKNCKAQPCACCTSARNLYLSQGVCCGEASSKLQDSALRSEVALMLNAHVTSCIDGAFICAQRKYFAALPWRRRIACKNLPLPASKVESSLLILVQVELTSIYLQIKP